MKRIGMLVFLASTVLSLACAGGNKSRERQDRDRPPSRQPGTERPSLPPPADLEQVTVSGVLGISRGMISLSSGGVTYYAPGLLRYASFIESLRDGAEVTAEGQAASPVEGDGKMLRVTKLTIGEKAYDLAGPDKARPGDGPFGGMPPRQPGR